MAFLSENMQNLVPNHLTGRTNSIWLYRSSDDTKAQIAANDYFVGGAGLGMRVGDIVMFEDIGAGATMHAVEAFDVGVTGAATVGAAIVA